MLRDSIRERFLAAFFISLVVNFIFLWQASRIAHQSVYQNAQPVEISRLNLEKLSVPRTNPHKIPAAHKALHKAVPTIKRAPQHPLQGAHHRILTALPGKSSPPSAGEYTVNSGGNAPLGKPIEKQNPGSAQTNPPAPARQGPTITAQPANQILPEIPDELKSENYKSYVRVRVEIAADGSFTPVLLTSSGNAEIDRRVLSALKAWKWKPALKNGFPLPSTQLFRFEFEVQ